MLCIQNTVNLQIVIKDLPENQIIIKFVYTTYKGVFIE
jgi:hypothetical protein